NHNGSWLYNCDRADGNERAGHRLCSDWKKRSLMANHALHLTAHHIHWSQTGLSSKREPADSLRRKYHRLRRPAPVADYCVRPLDYAAHHSIHTADQRATDRLPTHG